MLTLTKIKEGKDGKPYSGPVRVMVAGIGPIQKYRTEKGEEKRSVILGIADKEAAMKALLYDVDKLPTMKEGSSVMILNYIYKTTPYQQLVITKQSKVMQTSNVDVPENIQEQAKLIANPPAAQCVTIEKAKTSPVKSLVSVKGRVVMEEMARNVQVRGAPVPVKTITLKGGNDDIKVSLWRDLSSQNLMGQYITMKNVLVNLFKEEISLSTTARTEIEPCQEPSTKETVKIVAFGKEELNYSLVVEQGTEIRTLEIEGEALKTALGHEGEDLEQALLNRIPASAEILLRDSHVDEITFIL